MIFITQPSKGKLISADGTVLEGEFKGHKPNGEIKLETADGIRYAGFVIDGIKNGSGMLLKCSRMVEDWFF